MAKATAAESNMKPAKSQKAKPAKPAKASVFARLAQYFRDVRSEMKRVVWPNRQEVLNSSVVVLVTLIFFVAFSLLVDTVVVQALGLISKIKVG